MNKRILQAFIVLIVVLLGVSIVSETNAKWEAKNSISAFEEEVSNKQEVENGSMEGVNIIEEDSSNLISDINAKVAGIVVGGINKIFRIGIKLIEGVAGWYQYNIEIVIVAC